VLRWASSAAVAALSAAALSTAIAADSTFAARRSIGTLSATILAVSALSATF